ncbi:MAG: translation initiation factor IF-2, partial [Helicobacter sp.]|nr:translation initiation factor IF-2 [Helicobacter sp.]
ETKTASSTVNATQAEELYNYIISGKTIEKPKKEVESTNKKNTKAKETPADNDKKPKRAKSTKEKEKEINKTKVTASNPSTEKTSKETKKQTIEIPQKESKMPEEIKEDVPVTPQIDIQQENLTIKRTGLRIVKKRDFKEEESSQKKETTKEVRAQTLQDLLGNLNDNHLKEKRKKKKEKPVLKKHHQQKIDLLDNREFQTTSDEEEEDIILFDLSVQDEINIDEEEQKKVTTDRIKVQRHNPFMEQGSARRASRKKVPKPQKVEESISGPIKIPEEIRAYEFAEKIKRATSEIIKVLFGLGMMITKNDFLEKHVIELLAEEFGVEVEIINIADELDYTQLHDNQDEEEHLEIRAPVVTIMGHVDHGKTSLLDTIRNTKIASGEAGGITQHIGAYTINKGGKQITFIDTPGHEAFSEMRSRGTQVTDIAIIVIAADDGVKPQTIEALNHAKAANVPTIIAINKMDKPDANPDKIKAETAELGYTPIEWGGEHEFVHISAKNNQGIDDLLEIILLQAEILNLRANPNKPARAVVIESSLEKGKGPIATVIVQNGILKVGDSIIADTAFGRVRAINDDMGKNINNILPSGVGVVTGLNNIPS